MDKRQCRLCLGTPTVYFSLLEKEISQQLESLTAIKIKENDELSTITCTKCMLNVKLAFSIQQNIIKIDEKVRSSYLTHVVIKQEIPEVILMEDNEKILTPNPPTGESLKICDSVCKICGIQVDDRFIMKHIQEHFQSTQNCGNCNENFKNIQEYHQHILNCHQEEKGKVDSFVCQTCGSKFRYESLYNLHIKTHNNSNNNNNINNSNSKQTKSNETKKDRLVGQFFEVTVKVPTKTDKPLYSCDVCQKQFHHRKQFSAHTHLRKKCPICNAEITVTNLKKHISNHTSGPQICELCGATLKSLESLRGHMSHTHSTKIHTCEQCDKTFRKRYTYLLHLKKHSGEKGHICETCGKAFITLFYLNKHIKMAHLKLRPHKCQYCHKQFSSKFALRTHERQHTNETPYKCEVCGDGFRQNVSLRSHRKSKHNIIEPKTCACKVCGKEFGSEHAVVTHMRLH